MAAWIALLWLGVTVAIAQTAGVPSAIPSWTESDVALVLDASASMDTVDPRNRRLEAIQKVLAGLGEHDRVTFVRLTATPQALIPMTPVTDSNRPALLAAARSAVVTDPLAAGDLTRGVEEAARTIEADPRPDAMRSIIVLFSADMPPDIAEVQKEEFRGLLETVRAARMNVYAVAVGPSARRAQALTAIIGRRSARAVDRGEDIGAVLSEMLVAVQGVSSATNTTQVAVGQEFEETISVPTQVEQFQVDVFSLPDVSGMVPTSVILTGPNGVRISPAYEGTDGAIFRVPSPAAGAWKYRVTVARATSVQHLIAMNSGLQVVTYYPSLARLRERTPLYFGIRAPEGAVTRSRFRIAGRVYRVVSAEVTVQEPDGALRTLSKPTTERSRRSPLIGEFGVDFVARKPGEHIVRAMVRVRRGEERFLIEKSETIRAVEDPGEVPLLSLRAPEGGVLYSVTDSQSEGARDLEIVAQVTEQGSATPSPYMLGRFVLARVEYASSLQPSAGGGEGYDLAGERELIGSRSGGTVLLLPDMTVANTVQYTFPGRLASDSSRIFLSKPGYYRVTLMDSGAYRIDQSRGEVTLRAGRRDKSPMLVAIVAIGGFLVLLGGIFYVLVERGAFAVLPPVVAVAPATDVLIEEERFDFIDPMSDAAFLGPLVIPYEIVVYDKGILTNYTMLEHDSLVGANYVVKVLHGKTYLNGAPLDDSLDIHMMPLDKFSIGNFLTRIVGIETPVLLIQFEVENTGGYQVVNAYTEDGHSRWTLTRPASERVPPTTGSELRPDFTGFGHMLIGRDEAFCMRHPTHIPLFHPSVGEPHARLAKIVFKNGAIAYGIEAIKGNVYVNDRRLDPGESVEEFHTGTTLGIGQTKLKMTWTDADPLHPVLEVLEAPAAEPMPLGSAGLGAAAEEAAPSASPDQSLDDLFGEAAAAPSDDSASASLDDLMGLGPSDEHESETAEELSDELDDIDALVAEHEAAPASAPQAAPAPPSAPSEAVASLDDLFGAPAEAAAEQPAAPVAETPPASAPEVAAPASQAPAPSVTQETTSLDDLFAAPVPPPQPAETAPIPEVVAELLDPADAEQALTDSWTATDESDLDFSVVLVDFEQALAEPGNEGIVMQAAGAIQSQFGEAAQIGRLDSQRLIVLLPSVPEPEAVEAAEAIRAVIDASLSADAGGKVLYGVSSRSESGSDDADGFVQALQGAMQEAETAGGRAIVVHGQAE